jgi:hypothetical protein
VAEELALDQAVAHRRAVEDDQRAVAPGRQLVDGLGRGALAAPGLADEEQGRVGGADPLEQGEDLPHRHALADQLAEAVLHRGRDAYRGERGLEAELHVAQLEELAGLEVRLADLRPVDEGAVGRLEVLHQEPVALPLDHQVIPAHRGLSRSPRRCPATSRSSGAVGDGKGLPDPVGVDQDEVELLEPEALGLCTQAEDGVCGNGRGGTGGHRGRRPILRSSARNERSAR